MMSNVSHPVIQNILDQLNDLTPKARILGLFITQNPRKAVFMTTKELAETCHVSEATVVRFVSQLGYDGYSDFLQALRDFVDTGLTLPDRIDLPGVAVAGSDRFHQVLLEEMNNLRHLYESIDMDALSDFVSEMTAVDNIYVIGSRLSYTFAYYLGWSLTKVRRGIRILKGSDSTAIDWLSNAPAGSMVIIIATSRYPNELLKLAKVTRRLNLRLFLMTDSPLCPLIQFSHKALIAPSRSIPLIGYTTALSSIINYMVLELANHQDDEQKQHQQQLEQTYRENDILFNLHVPPANAL